jgi:NAD(P)-dependent dehydrogenase (short-subunit alcohol dehydrogenase family)
MRDLEGKVAFITGGANGLGLAMAKSFASAGMKIVLADIEQDALDKAIASFGETNANVHGIIVDVTDRAAMAAAADEAENVFGPVHVVCNNAGVAAGGTMDTISYEDWDWVLGVNIGGVVNGIQTFIDRMKKHGEGGHFVNTASLAGFIAGAGGPYATSKFAVVGMSEVLRNDLEPHNIGVSVLCPAFVKTRIHEADRNRPDEFHNPDAAEITDEERAVSGAMVNSGIEPEIIGECVLEGVRNNELYLFPHPEMAEVVKIRFDQVLASMDQSKANEEQLPLAKGAAAQMANRNLRDTE